MYALYRYSWISLSRQLQRAQVSITMIGNGKFEPFTVWNDIDLRFQIYHLRIFGLFVAFLVFMALKVKPKTLAEFLKPIYYVRAKKNNKK